MIIKYALLYMHVIWYKQQLKITITKALTEAAGL